MKKIIQPVDYKLTMNYDGGGFEELEGDTDTEAYKESHIYYSFYAAGNAHVVPKGLDYSGTEGHEFACNVGVYIFEDRIQLESPHAIDEKWAEFVFINSVSIIKNKYENFAPDIDLDADSLEFKKEFRYSSANPLLSALNIVKLFDKSLFRFNYIEDHDNIEGLEFDEDDFVHALISPTNEQVGVYYLHGKDEFRFKDTGYTTEDTLVFFSKICYELLSLHNSLEKINNPYDEIINTDVLMPFLETHGEKSVDFFNLVVDSLIQEKGDEQHYSIEDVYTKMKNKYPSVTKLSIMRMEVDLIAILFHEYPRTPEFKDPNWFTKLQDLSEKELNNIFWLANAGQKENLDSYVNRNIPDTGFSYNRNIGFEGQILYYEDVEGIKIAIQLEEYTKLIDSDVMSPDCWIARPIGTKRTIDDISDSVLENYLNTETNYYVTKQEFEKSINLLKEEVYDELDIVVNEPKDFDWD